MLKENKEGDSSTRSTPFLDAVFGRADVVVIRRREAQAAAVLVSALLAAAVYLLLSQGACTSKESNGKNKISHGESVCSVSGRGFEYWEPCLPDFFPGCKPCSATYTIQDLSPVFEMARTEWSIYGKTEPWWSVLTDDRWKGKLDIPAVHKDEFYESDIGVGLINELLHNFSSPGKVAKRNSAMDFGCGVGRPTFALHQKLGYKRVVGVDQSIWHLEIARREAERKGIARNVEFVVSNPDMLAALKCEKFDFAYSFIALQHIIPPLIVVYIEQICDSLKIGGTGFFQVPTKLIADYSQFKCSFDWAIKHMINEGGMQVWSLSEHWIVHALEKRGCKPKLIFDLDAIGIPGSESKAFYFFKETAV